MQAIRCRSKQAATFLVQAVLLLSCAQNWCAAGAQPAPCRFNSMCLCAGPPNSKAVTTVLCDDASLYKMPAFPHEKITHLEVTNNRLLLLEAEAMAALPLQLLKLSGNRIRRVDNKAFSSMISTLTTLDLGANSLSSIPFNALLGLRTLSRLDLTGNEISTLTGDWGNMSESLTTLLLANNDVLEIPSEEENDIPGRSFRHFKTLISLDVSGNRITSLSPRSLPNTLRNLDLSHNHVQGLPCAEIDLQGTLRNVHLRNNFIQKIPEYRFTRNKRLDTLDLGLNALKYIPSRIFDGTIVIRDLILDYNSIRILEADAFNGLNSSRIILSHNDIESLHGDAFSGLEAHLEYLDLEHNLLTALPEDTFRRLKSLSFLYLSSNFIANIHELPSTIRVLSISSNSLEEIPSYALRNCRHLSYLNLGYNLITDISTTDFAEWGENLETLLLRNNRISRLSDYVFISLINLKELSLSFNDILYVENNSFANVSDTLKILEMSFSLYPEDLPGEVLKQLHNLMYLALDNNNFESISVETLANFNDLVHLNLAFNSIQQLPDDLFANHGHLVDLDLSYNSLKRIYKRTFYQLSELQKIDLSSNNIMSLDQYGFAYLANLLSLDISVNMIETIEEFSFAHVPNIMHLDLSSNILKQLELKSFHNITNEESPLSLNVSHNLISNLAPADGAFYVHILDLTNNRLCDVYNAFMNCLAGSLKKLYLSSNNISKLDNQAFGELSLLEELKVDRNKIITVRRRAFHGLDNLHILDLGYNRIEVLQNEQFANLRHLRVLKLNNNHIRSLFHDIFQNTLIEHLDLSCNEIVILPSLALTEVGFTLRSLHIGGNEMATLDDAMFMGISYILDIDISRNKLTTLPVDIFQSSKRLQSIDLSHNNLVVDLDAIFRRTPNVMSLTLSNIRAPSLPHLRLPVLRRINLCSNRIENFSSVIITSMYELTDLDLCDNKLTSVPSELWFYLPKLKRINLSRNPIISLSENNFQGLPYLKTINLYNLPDLKEIHTKTLSGVSLESLLVETNQHIQNMDTIGKVASAVPSLRSLSLKLAESTLSVQLLHSTNRKLETLQVSGRFLSVIRPEGFDSFRGNPRLTVRIKDSLVSEFPTGLFYQLRRVGELGIDLRGNAINYITPDAFYPNSSSWQAYGTRLVTGGLLISDNPLQCDCALVWLGHWLRRWLRETVQVRTVSSREARQMQTLARDTTCLQQRAGRLKALLQLRPDDLLCHASALSSHGLVYTTPNIIGFWIVVLVRYGL